MIKKYLKRYTDQLAFITIENFMTQSKKDISFLKDVPIPVSVESIQQHAQKESFQTIPFETIVEGMIYVLGVDRHFKYNPQYIQFLKLTHEKILDYILYQGIKHAEEQNYYDAIIFFRAALFMEKENLSALYNYGKCCRDIFDLSKDVDEKKDFKAEAIYIFETLAELYPDFAPSYYYLGFFYFNEKMFEKTRITWEKYLGLSDDEERKGEIQLRLIQLEDHVTYERGYTYILNQKYEKGLELLLPLEERHPKWWNLLFFIGLAYRNMKDYTMAIVYFKKVMSIKPSQIDTINELGLCYTSQGDFKNAEKYFKKAILLNGNDHEVLSNLAVVYMNTGQFDEAEECLIKASEIAPDDEIVLQWQKMLQGIKREKQ